MPVFVIAIDVRVADVTVSDTDPLTPSAVALMCAVPAATPVATPLLPDELLTVATAVLSDAQTDCDVSVWVVPSLKVPTAVKVSFAAGWSDAPVGATAIELKVAAVTVKTVVSETAPTLAVIVVLPAVNAEARPDGTIVATAVEEDVHDVT